MLLQRLLLCSVLLTAIAARTHPENHEVAIDWDTFHSLIDGTHSIHSILHSLGPKYKHGVFGKDSKALKQVHSEDPPLATSFLELAKRQSNLNAASSTTPAAASSPTPAASSPTPAASSPTPAASSTTPYTTPSVASSTTPYTTPSVASSTTPYTTPSVASSTTPYTTPSVASSTTPSSFSSTSSSEAPYSSSASSAASSSSNEPSSVLPSPTTKAIAPSTPAGASAVKTIDGAIIFSQSTGGLITVASSNIYVTFQPKSSTILSTYALPNGQVTTATSVVIVNKPIPVSVVGSDILSTNGFSSCLNNGTVTLNNLNMQFDRSTNLLTFDVSGSSSKQQKVTVSLVVAVYGTQVSYKRFDPCDAATKVDQLCPVPQGSFYVTGSRIIPSKYVDPIPSYAYTVPDLDGTAKVTLTSMDSGEEVACIQTLVGNGKSVRARVVPYVAAGIAVAALGLSCFRALLAAERPAQEQLNIGVSGYPGAPKHPRASTRSPNFGEVIGWFQSMAMNGMYSVQYPSVYRRFAENFAFSTGIIPWTSMQMSIDSFRKATGGNLTDDSYPYIRNAILVFPSSNTTANIAKRNSVLSNKVALDGTNTSVNGLSGSSFSSSSKTLHFVQGIEGYVEQLSVPQANVFVTVLLTFVITVAAIIVGILLFKAILEIWALVGSFPKKLTTFRKEYWRIIYQTIVKLIFLLYSVWTLYCIFQFTHGDSWAAKLLAGVTLGAFTAILVFYCCKIWSVSRNFRKLGDDGALFDDKETWKKYNLFYADYKRGYWWLFIPAIIYMFVKGCVLAAGDGHGLVQTVCQLIIESLMLILLLWSRPYILKSGNWINITIQVARVLSVACTLVFVEQFGVTQTPKTIVGLILIGFQSFLTCILAILIAANLLIVYCKENPHRNHRRRKEAERMYGDRDILTPFDNRELLPMEPQPYKTAPQQHWRDLPGATLINRARH